MVSRKDLRKAFLVLGALLVALSIFAPMGFAADEEGLTAGGMTVGDGIRATGIAIGAGIAVAGAAIGTARAQAAIGAGGTGAMAEKPELFGRVFILVALPETIVVLGFVVGLLLALAI